MNATTEIRGLANTFGWDIHCELVRCVPVWSAFHLDVILLRLRQLSLEVRDFRMIGKQHVTVFSPDDQDRPSFCKRQVKTQRLTG